MPDSVLQSGLIGRGILSSRSPWLHEQEAHAQGLALRYDLFDFTARGWASDHLGRLLEELVGTGFVGCNVTFPFKQAVIPLLHGIAQSADSVGAVNTVVIRDGICTGHNTDMEGFRDAFRRNLAGVSRQRVLLFGAGGAGAAVATALLMEGVEELCLVDADGPRAAHLADQLGQRFADRRIAVNTLSQALAAQMDGIVNATPMGMASHPGAPLPVDWLVPQQWVADIIYFPRETALLQHARTIGCRVMNGGGMVVAQAAHAFSLITGHEANLLRMMANFG